ncbi:MAG TPA: gluconokinase [Micromonosporaceae bacterium]|nr:gluconokinase [Micromonosporaceae bacterium]
MRQITHRDTQRLATRPGSASHVVVMGVTGVGKSTVAARLARRLNRPYAEADAFHPRSSIEKMASGVPLTDSDRWPWLRRLRDWLSGQGTAGQDTVLSCSALRRAYRDLLREAIGQVRFVHLAGEPSLVAERVAGRSGHFMPPDLLASQFRILEPLAEDEDGVTIGIEASPDEITHQIIDWLGDTSGTRLDDQGTPGLTNAP